MCSVIASAPYLTPCTIEEEQERCFFFPMKCSDIAFDHPNVPSLVAQLEYTLYNWYNWWKWALRCCISSPFAPFTLKPCLLQMALNSI